MNGFKDFLYEYRGALIGLLFAIVVLCTQLYKLIIGIVLLCLGMFVGNYIQRNKEDVKEKIKSFVDRM